MNWLDALRQALGLSGGPHGLREGRSRMRLDCTMQVRLATDTGATMQTHTTNVNTRGVTVQVETPLKRQSTVQVYLLSGQAGGPSLHLQARTIWCRKLGDRQEAGLEFFDLSDAELPDLLAFLRQELAVPVLDDRQKRQFRRIQANWPVEYVVSTLEHRQAQVKDVSPCGCLLLSRYPLLLWSDIGLSMRPEPTAMPIQAHAVVRRCTKLPGQDWWEIACPLVTISPADQSRLVAAIERHLARQK